MTNKKRIGIQIPQVLYQELKEEAIYSGRTLSGLILQILLDWVRQREKEEK